ncbi:Uncharacterised protein [Mycobacterium tuberculosis]|nr:Uncharacterised protein [Mycobacterium tuberculosis]CKV33628.1 Uncharacterised protein [Mycobacterium tuberculosis]
MGKNLSLPTVVVVDVEIFVSRHQKILHRKSLKMENQVRNVSYNWN